ADVVERRQRHVDVVADAVDVDEDAIGMFVEDAPSEERDHPIDGGRYCRQERACGAFRDPGSGIRDPAGGIECKWQMATASASEASCGVGTALRPSSSLIIWPTCCFSA